MNDILRHPIIYVKCLRDAIRSTIDYVRSGYRLAPIVDHMMTSDRPPYDEHLSFPMPGYYTITAEYKGRFAPVAYHENQQVAELFAVGMSMALRKKIAIAVVDGKGVQTYRYPRSSKHTEPIRKWT